ncbi:nuclear polyadenylated RNA-binding protein 3-like [Carica papaya]|uniref:nuclear polyadenylated RNA-binding protein 3-like n=1 Tax=Carica papaya TaxID=3649 RepID=UPI000B8CA0F4|nr:nuclear polyadenylated RNA-binding protein 3-like [Carica papaya]
MAKRRTSHKKHNNEARQSLVGVEAAVVWAGALAVAGLMTAFSLNKRRRRRDRNKGSESNSQVQGLPLILQSNPTENHSFAGHRIAKTEIIQTESCESVSTQSLILEEKAELWIVNGEDENNPEVMLYNDRNEEFAESCHQQILLSDDSAEQSVTSPDDCSNLEELKLIMNDSGEVLQLLKTNGAKNDEEEDDDDIDNDENIKEREQERCEVSGSGSGSSSSSMECNDEAVWAEETTEISSPGSKYESTIRDHVVEETDEETRVNETRVENSVVILNEIEINGKIVKVMMNDEMNGFSQSCHFCCYC